MSIKFIYSEKHKKFDEISTLILKLSAFNNKEISLNGLAFSENLNFT